MSRHYELVLLICIFVGQGLTEFQLVPHTQTKIKAPHQDVLFHWKFTDVLSTNNTTANITTNNTTINSNNLRFGHVSRFTLKKFEIIYNGFQLSSLHGTRKLHGYDIIYVPGMSNITFVVRRNVADIREGLHFAHAQVLNKMTGAVIKTSASFKLVIAEDNSHKGKLVPLSNIDLTDSNTAFTIFIIIFACSPFVGVAILLVVICCLKRKGNEEKQEVGKMKVTFEQTI